jgi:hypothetical protein
MTPRGMEATMKKIICSVLLTLLSVPVAAYLIPGFDLRFGTYSVSDGGWIVDETGPRPPIVKPHVPYPDRDVGRFLLTTGEYVILSHNSGKSLRLPGVFRIDTKTGQVLKYHVLFGSRGEFLEGWVPTINSRPALGTPSPPANNFLLRPKQGVANAISEVR